MERTDGPNWTDSVTHPLVSWSKLTLVFSGISLFSSDHVDIMWLKFTLAHSSPQLVGVDIADVSIKQAEDRYKTLRRQQDRSLFAAEFHCVDTCKESILDCVDDKSIRFDLTSCQFVYNYSFDTYPRAEAMLTNACRYLKMGGFFIGT